MPATMGSTSGVAAWRSGPSSTRGQQRTAPAPQAKRPRQRGGYPGAPTGDEVAEGLRNAGPDAGDRRDSRQSRSSRAKGSRSRPGSSASGQILTGPKTGALITEFLIAVLLIIIGVFTSSKSYAARMSAMLWQLTSLFLVFFVLALLDKGGKMSKAAVAFGAMIDLGILFVATQQSLPGVSGTGGTTSPVQAFATALTGTGAQVGDAVLTVDDATDTAPAHEIPQLDMGGTDTTTAAKPKGSTVNT